MRAQVYGHRGAPAERTENTIGSFARALAHGVDGLESDIHETADGVLVLAHDDDLARVAGVPTRIAEVPYRELVTIPLGPERAWVPTLDEALDTFPETFFNLEIKPPRPALARRVAAHLRARGDEQRVRLAGADHRALAPIAPPRWRGPRSSSALEVASLYYAPMRLLRPGFLRGDAVQVPVTEALGPVRARFDSEDFFARAARVGAAVHFWTINDPAEAARLVRLGAAVIMTDDPARIVPAVRAATS